MAISITAAEVKARLHIGVATYDTDIGNIITEMKDGLTGILDTTAIVTYEAACELGMRDVICGEVQNYLRRMPGYGESVAVGGVALGEEVEGGDKLIERGLLILAPYTHEGYANLNMVKAEAALRKVLAEARDDDAAAIADAELLKLQNEAAKLGSEKLRVDAEELKTDAETAKLTAEELKVDAEAARIAAETTTEAEKPAKVAADADLSTALAAEADARAAIKGVEKARMDAEDTSMADVTEVPQEDHSHRDSILAIDAEEYDR